MIGPISTTTALLLSFPSQAPYRFDQVMLAPQLMLGLAVGQLVLAGMLWKLKQASQWWAFAAAFISLNGVFFALANWGTSDITRFSHYLAIDPGNVVNEPLWVAAAPLISALPYRLASVHGAVAAGLATVPLLLAKQLQQKQWGGIWALLVLWSPLLRNFLQNGVTRQALATLLIIPVVLHTAGWYRFHWGWVGACIAGSALGHNSLPLTLLLALVPLATRPGVMEKTEMPHLLKAGGLLLGSMVLSLSQPAVLEKLNHYVLDSSYFHTYGLRNEVFGLQVAALAAIVLTIWRAGLTPQMMGRDHDARTLFAYSLLLGIVQVSMATGVLAPVLSRCLDPIGLFWLFSLMVWVSRHGCTWSLLPACLIVGESFIDDRILAIENCITGDQFLCIPDRLPWQIHW